MYSTIPTDELIKIMDFMCVEHGINEKLKQELLNI